MTKGKGSMFKQYKVRLDIRERLMGGVPKSPDLVDDWLAARAPTRVPQSVAGLDEHGNATSTAVATLAELETEVIETIVPEEDKVWSGFQSDEMGLFVRTDHVKAHIKDCSNVLQEFVGTKNLRSKVANRVFAYGHNNGTRIYLRRDDVLANKDGLAVLTKPDDYYEHPVHVMTRQGPRSALKRNDYVEKPFIEFTLRVLEDEVIDLELLNAIFTYGAEHGFGAERSLGHGQYEFTITEA